MQRGAFALDAGFDLPTPGVAALFGRSGCGKSTLIDIIAGLLDPHEGSVELDGTPLLDTRRQIDVPPERRRMGYVFQDSRLFPHLRVAANLRYAERRARGPATATLESVIELLGLGALLGRRVHQLSGGERQRVAIGRALLSRPRLLLLDEPLAALDRARRDELLPYLETLRDALAIPMVYVTHDFEEVLRLATHIVLMENGKVLAQGGVSEMSLEPGLRSIVGRDRVGAIVDGSVLGVDRASALTRVRLGHGEINVQATGLRTGAVLRVQLLARDIIVSTEHPQHLSVRNILAGVIARVDDDDAEADMVAIDIDGEPGLQPRILARITKAATRELGLRPGMRAWALIKSVSLRGHSFNLSATHVNVPHDSPSA